MIFLFSLISFLYTKPRCGGWVHNTNPAGPFFFAQIMKQIDIIFFFDQVIIKQIDIEIIIKKNHIEIIIKKIILK